MGIPVCIPEAPANALRYVTAAIEKNWISALCLDPEVNFIGKLERGMAEYVGVKHGVAVTNGTSALHLATASLKLGPGDEVIVPASTIISSANCAIQCGARPVFVDVDPHTWCIDAARVAAAITPRTRAIVPVHLYGYPADMNALRMLADTHGLALIEDAAEALGTEYHGRRAGSLGDVSIFSFYANKVVTCGEGGMLLTDDDDLAARARLLKNLAFGDPRFIHTSVGFNYRMNNLTAAYAYASFEELEASVRKRRRNAARYNAALADVVGITLPPESDETHLNSHWMYAICIDQELYGRTKTELRDLLKTKFGIDTRDFFFPLHRQPPMLELGYASPDDSLPVSERLWEQGLYLPSSNNLSHDQIDMVADALRDLRRV